MKKFIFLTISAIIINILIAHELTFAGLAEGQQCTANSECNQGLLCYGKDTGTDNKKCTNALEVLTQRVTQPNPTTIKDKPADNIKNLPDIELESGVATAIKAILRSAMLLTIIAIVVSAIYYITSRGKEEDITKAKDIILYLIIGMAIMAGAYGIVAGITKFNVFE